MKISLFVGSVVLIACTRRKPDWDQVECRQFYDTRQIWKDSARGYIRTDTVRSVNDQLSVLVCGTELEKLENFKPYWLRVCAGNDPTEVLYWEYVIPTLR